MVWMSIWANTNCRLQDLKFSW